jgi:hypothetical protein
LRVVFNLECIFLGRFTLRKVFNLPKRYSIYPVPYAYAMSFEKNFQIPFRPMILIISSLTLKAFPMTELKLFIWRERLFEKIAQREFILMLPMRLQ